MCFIGAWRAIKRDPLAASADQPDRPSAQTAYFTGVLMTLLNPLTLAFWFIAVPAAVGPITEEPGRDLPMICAGVFAGTIGWVVVFTGAIALAGRWRRAWWTTLADALGGATLLAFAGLALWRLARSFL
jgi:threonine/homoserine/homoserine lactone efflux protein